MRVFFDTNVLISAFVSHGQCFDLFEHCMRKHFVFTSSFILKEFSEKLQLKFKYPRVEVTQALNIILSGATTVSETLLAKKFCRDADDDHVIAAALTSKADCIITGDKDLLDLKKVLGIPIVSPRDFWKLEELFTA